jgi:phosphohistidine phosphatase
MREAIRGLGLAPDVILVSPARRTRETLEALEPWDDTPLVEPVDALYLATAAQLFGVVRDQSETIRSIMLIGHNPGMHEFGVSLAGRTSLSDATNRLLAGFPTGALAEFAIASPWRQLSAGGGQLVRFLTPRDLRDGEAVETAD